ncbi:unnamed protein product [Spirodela intermedia]|uniref:Uncharacterized protein n=1 Tax=Spirodela intermedia TaxID=51605 RepID=A0A7I8IE36_SPIIN|nr:unnamed protein product [Spirodela intermedia]CAA6655353.1 unnamed protein product [Spirodela intermedia]
MQCHIYDNQGTHQKPYVKAISKKIATRIDSCAC